MTYLLNAGQEIRLQKIREKYKGKGLDLTLNMMFGIIMETGSKYDIGNKFKFHKWKFGLREDL